MALVEGQAALMRPCGMQIFAPSGYGQMQDRPKGDLIVLTPEPMIAVMDAGWRPSLHDTAL